jgi:hypothetical protein
MKDIKRLQNAPWPIQTTLPFKEMNWASSSSLNNPHKTILKDLASKKKCIGTSCYSMKISPISCASFMIFIKWAYPLCGLHGNHKAHLSSCCCHITAKLFCWALPCPHKDRDYRI